MQRTLYFITRHLDVRGGRQDEFVTHWYLHPREECAFLGNSERKIVVIHGCRERFPVGHEDHHLIGLYRQALDACINTSGERGLLCHTFNQNLPLRQALGDFAFACTYSIDSGKGEWALIEALIHAFDDDHEISRQDAFETAFDALWSFFKPDTSLRQELEAEHKKLAGSVVEASPAPTAKYSNHTRHYLLIWNTISGAWFAQELGKYLKTINDNKRLRLELVTSRTAFESVDWSVNWQKVFVLAELYWSDKDWEGVPLVFELLKKRDAEDSPLEILTCSAFRRNDLYKCMKDKDHLIVKAFPHLQLKEASDFSLLPRMYVSRRKWEYKQIELLDNREILSSLLHQVSYIKPDRPNFEAAIGRLYTEVSNLRSITGKDVFLSAGLLKDCNNIKEMAENLAALKGALEAMLKKLEVDELPKQHPGQVMIAEDDDYTRRKIFELFSAWFQNVVAFDNGPAALAELKKNAVQYDALVADLELLDGDGLEDTVQGVDLIDFCEQHAKWIARRVVTGLARTSLPRRLTAFGANRIILKQSPDTGSEDVVFVLPHWDEKKFMEALHMEIDKLAIFQQKSMPGPSNGVFAAAHSGRESPDLKAVYYELTVNHPEDFENHIQEIFQKARQFIRQPQLYPVNTKFIRTENKLRSSWEPRLWDLLTLRLIAITKQASEGKVKYIDYGDDSGLYFDLGFKATLQRSESKPNVFRQWLNTKLGFSFEPDSKENEVWIKLDINDDELFPHEQDLKKDGQIENYIPLREVFSTHCCDQIQDIFNEVLNVIGEAPPKEDAIARMRIFSSDSFLADLRVILKYLLDFPRKELRVWVGNITKSLSDDIDKREDEVYLPDWLENILNDY